MKKIVILALFSLMGLTAMAQSLPVNFGIHAGWNNTKIKVQDVKIDPKSGYMIGAFARINLGSIYLEPAFNFVHKESNIYSFGKFKYSAIDIPLMVGYNFLKLPMFKLRGFLGPVASFVTKDLKKDFNTDRMMWNGKIGAGVDLWKVTFDLDYEFGLKKFGDDVKGPKSWNITIGFKII